MLWALLTRETGLLKSSGLGNLDVFGGKVSGSAELCLDK